MRALKLSRDYAESLKMAVKKRKRESAAFFPSGSGSDSDQIANEQLKRSTSSASSSPSYARYGSSSMTSQLLNVVNRSIQETPWEQRLDNMVCYFSIQIVTFFWQISLSDLHY
ncbi:unnamed protein product [Gongylonema pulchrum]|uniref:Transcription factor n=1 Tax=Gongylonema pulchrum TaxID=637853 RepID=A0A183D6Z6_9BILA|nr:unnamed protein product [Gongylonema pulchrum]